ncbi:zinc finger BED domain-containing protein 5-like [Neoarius graeffei]|uniref:zinc finger BED domain-containing protein 5-like n=1 Tax=Neoarius graeffei TaxID=443677 RepID=UPI00298CE190|nr:zinc finger BED domain-containing protein 5-like [Neoarius graeffei]
MDKFLKRKGPDVNSNNPPTSDAEQTCKNNWPKKSRKYENEYINYGFTVTAKNGQEFPKCVLCLEVLSNECLKLSKLKRHLHQKHPAEAEKSMEYFKRKEELITKQSATFVQQAKVPERALRASFLASYHIAGARKLHTIGEDLLLPATKDIVKEMLGEDAAKKIDAVPLSDNTVSRRISDMAEDVSTQLLEQVRASDYYALQLDESTDVANVAKLLVYIRFFQGEKFAEEILFCKALERRGTGREIFEILDNYIRTNGLDWSRCVGVCSDGAAAMTRRNSGVTSLIKQKAPHAVFTHCMLHREALVAKRIDDKLNLVLQEAVQVVNFIKTHPLKHRLFAILCNEMGARFHGLLLHSSVRWPSRGAVLNRVYEMQAEIAEFLSSEKHQLADRFTDATWLLKLAYLADIFHHLNVLNQSMQGRDTYILHMQDKVRAFSMKITLWASKLQEGNTEMFPQLHQELLSSGHELDTIAPLIQSHLEHLQGYFRDYFPDLDNTQLNWVRTPFAPDVGSCLDLKSQEELIEMATSWDLKVKFETLSLPNYWLLAKMAVWKCYKLEQEGKVVDLIVMDRLTDKIKQESLWTMMFTDDLVICSESREQVEERWSYALERRGMKGLNRSLHLLSDIDSALVEVSGEEH